MAKDMLTWLRSEIEARLAAARAAADKPRHIQYQVKDPSASWGIRWESRPAHDDGVWAYEEVKEGYYRGQGRVVSTCGEDLGIVAGSCNCCGVTAEGRKEDLLHIVANDPRDTIARCEADLAILDEHEIHDSGFGQSCTVCFEEGRDGADVPVEAPCRTVRLLAYGRRHRPGWHPDWAPEGMAP